MSSVLIVDDEESIRETLSEFLKDDGHSARTAETAVIALDILSKEKIDVVISDIILPQITGVELLTTIKKEYPLIQVVLITGEPNVETASQAVREGAFDYLTKPVTERSVCQVVRSASKIKRLEDENRKYKEKLETLVEIRTKQLDNYSNRLRHVADNAKKLALCNSVAELAPKVLQILSQNMGAQGGSFYLRKNEYLELIWSLDQDHSARKIKIPPVPQSVIGKLFERKEAFVVEDIRTDGNYKTSGWTGYSNGSLIALPCQNPDGIIRGVLTLHNKEDQPFNEQDIEIGQIVASHSVEALRAVELMSLLKESEKKYRSIAEQSLTGIFVEQDEKIAFVNSRMTTILGYDDDECWYKNQSFTDLAHGSDTIVIQDLFNSKSSLKKTTEPMEVVLSQKSGNPIWTEILISRVEHLGRPGYMGHIIDISARKKAEQEQKNLEEQLRQSQKMEAIGRLAGGVAHDFNNMLTGILGYSDMLLSDLSESDPLYEDIHQIQRASKKASLLTHQLLAFSRKQIISPRVINPNEIIEQSKKMIERIIGEDVVLHFDPDEKLRNIRADPAQLDQILINLATNARDAMPQGGTLTIKTANVTSEDMLIPFNQQEITEEYVSLSVSDTGFGMDSDTKTRIFEPFFSTKEQGKGTGLGLSTVYGIVRQNEGFITVESQENLGTTFDVYFPQVIEESETIFKQPTRNQPTGTETILLVEDEPIVRTLARRILAHQGYHVIETNGPGEAFLMCKEYEKKIDLLLTDVVMPRMNGTVLYEKIRLERPGIKALFMSGYSEDIVVNRGILIEGTQFIQKPFTLETLAKKVRDVLDQ